MSMRHAPITFRGKAKVRNFPRHYTAKLAEWAVASAVYCYLLTLNNEEQQRLLQGDADIVGRGVLTLDDGELAMALGAQEHTDVQRLQDMEGEWLRGAGYESSNWEDHMKHLQDGDL